MIIAIKILATMLVISMIMTWLSGRAVKNTAERIDNTNPLYNFNEYVKLKSDYRTFGQVYNASFFTTLVLSVIGITMGIWSIF